MASVLASRALSGVCSLTNLSKKLLDSRTAYASASDLFKALTPYMTQVSKTAGTVANNLFVAKGSSGGVGLSYYAGRFSPLALGAIGINTLAVATREFFKDGNPVAGLVDGAFLGSYSSGFGLKRVYELMGLDVSSKAWGAFSSLSKKVADVTGVLSGVNMFRNASSVTPKDYISDDHTQVWPASTGQSSADSSDPAVTPAQRRAGWKKVCEQIEGAAFIGICALPFLKGVGSKLPLLRNVSAKAADTWMNAACGAANLAGAIFAMDLINSKADEVDKNELGLVSKGLSYVAEKARSFKWSANVTKVAAACLSVLSRTFETLGKAGASTWASATSVRLLEGAKFANLSALIEQPQALVRSIQRVGNDLRTNGLPSDFNRCVWACGAYASGILSNLSLLMMKGGRGLIFAAEQTGYPLTGRVKALAGEASKKWYLIPEAISLSYDLATQFKAGSSSHRVLSDIQRSLGLSEEAQAEGNASVSDRDNVNEVVRLGLRTLGLGLGVISWIQGKQGKNTALVFSILGGAWGAFNLRNDWHSWSNS